MIYTKSSAKNPNTTRKKMPDNKKKIKTATSKSTIVKTSDKSINY